MARVIGVDVGGTFTDVVVFDEGSLVGFKVSTTPDQAKAVAGAIEWRTDDTLLHGTTAATNALLEQRGASVTLVTDEGYEDLIEIARQDRPSLYDSSVDRPQPLVARDRRIGHGGDLAETISRVRNGRPDVVVVGLLDSYRDSALEHRLAAGIRESVGVPVIEASAVSPEFREYERIATGALSAYLTPSVALYLDRLSSRVQVERRLVMTSSGGLLPFDQASSEAARLVLSGPAGGVVATAALARSHGYDSVISFDMGGTSTDVCRVSGGSPSVDTGHRVAGRVNRVPSVPVRTIGAGGGSVGWVDAGGALRVGPRSAGAVPGPAAYGQGGMEPTVTDANLVVGHIPSNLALAGKLGLSIDLANVAVEDLAAKAEMTGEATAWGILEIVDSHMEHALRAVSIEEGADPRDAVLVAFGGAGGLHASRLAKRLGIPKVLIPPLSGVFSALGLLLATPLADAARTVMLAEGDGQLARLGEMLTSEAGDKFRALFGAKGDGSDLGFDCRYVGQSHELEVTAGADWTAIRASFEAAHLRHFGFMRADEPIEVVNIRSRVAGTPPLTWGQVTGQRSHLMAGTEIQGPTVLTEETSAVLLEEGDRLVVLDDGTLEITCG